MLSRAVQGPLAQAVHQRVPEKMKIRKMRAMRVQQRHRASPPNGVPNRIIS